MSGLSDFLRDRIGEDEAWWHAEVTRIQAQKRKHGLEVDETCWSWKPHILAELAAKRLIVMAADEGNPATEWMSDLTLDWVLRVMALVYSSHPDYDESWRP